MQLYEISAKDARQNIIPMSDYRGKVLLIVNTATGCGFTPQYEGLEALYREYLSRGFEVLDFPCNQFLGQAPGSDEEIEGFCRLHYDVTFKTFSKIEVNGPRAHPLFVYLKSMQPEDSGEGGFLKKLMSPLRRSDKGDIRWNFTKFLISRSGEVLRRYPPSFKPEDIGPDIEEALREGGE